MRRSALLPALLLSAGCDRAPSPEPRPGPTAAPRLDWAARGCDGRPDRLPAAAAWGDTELAALFGAPASTERFAFGDAVGEFRIRLRNHLRTPADAAVRVTERTWARGECRLTVWSVPRNGIHVAIDSLIWSTDVQF